MYNDIKYCIVLSNLFKTLIIFNGYRYWYTLKYMMRTSGKVPKILKSYHPVFSINYLLPYYFGPVGRFFISSYNENNIKNSVGYLIHD